MWHRYSRATDAVEGFVKWRGDSHWRIAVSKKFLHAHATLVTSALANSIEPTEYHICSTGVEHSSYIQKDSSVEVLLTLMCLCMCVY